MSRTSLRALWACMPCPVGLHADFLGMELKRLLDVRDNEARRLIRLKNFYDGVGKPRISGDVSSEVRRIAEISRVNIIRPVVNSLVQSLSVEGYRSPGAATDRAAWEIWQANRMPAMQSALHRSAAIYGAAYAIVLPGSPLPEISLRSPMQLTALFADEMDTSPVITLDEHMGLLRVIDADSISWHRKEHGNWVEVDRQQHGLGYVPVVRYLPEANLDNPVCGEVEPLIMQQESLDQTVFSMKVAEHYAAFKQRYVIGMTSPSEEQAFKMSAASTWLFPESKDEMQVGQFDATDLAPYLAAKESTIAEMAVVAQVPINEITGTLVNLSADAIAMARDSNNRKVNAAKTMLGQAHAETLAMAGRQAGYETDPAATVLWDDVGHFSLSQIADAFTKLASGLGIPQEMLWSKIPGVTQSEVEEWKQYKRDNDAVAELAALLDQDVPNGEDA